MEPETEVENIVGSIHASSIDSLFNYFPENCLLSSQLSARSEVRSNSLRQSFQHTHNPFDLVAKFSINNPTRSNGLCVCWNDCLNELDLTSLFADSLELKKQFSGK